MLKNFEVPIRSAQLALASKKFEVPTTEIGIRYLKNAVRSVVARRLPVSSVNQVARSSPRTVLDKSIRRLVRDAAGVRKLIVST